MGEKLGLISRHANAGWR